MLCLPTLSIIITFDIFYLLSLNAKVAHPPSVLFCGPFLLNHPICAATLRNVL